MAGFSFLAANFTSKKKVGLKVACRRVFLIGMRCGNGTGNESGEDWACRGDEY